MNDERNEVNDERNDEMPAEELAARTRALLGATVASAPGAPSVADIEKRISSQVVAGKTESVGSTPSMGVRPVVVTEFAGSMSFGGNGSEDEGADKGQLADYVTPTAPDGETRPGARWPRVVLVAAAIVAVVAIGVAMVNRSEDDTVVPAGSPASNDVVVGVVPSTPPEGQALTWIGSSSTEEGDATMLRYHGYSGLQSLVITSTVFNQQPLPAEGTSTTIVVGTGATVDRDVVDESVNVRMGDHSVLLTDEGRTARFVGPVGMVVEVTGEPDDVAAVVPTLETVDSAQWRSFVDEMSADIAAMPEVAAYVVATGGPEGFDIEGVDRIAVSVHANPESTALAAVPEDGTGTASGVVAGTCLTVDGVTSCRPTDPMGDGVPRNVETAQDVLIDGVWWQFGWATDELTSYTLEPDTGGEVEAFWYFEGTGHDDEMTWFAARIPDEAREVTVELGGSGGFVQRRPAS